MKLNGMRTVDGNSVVVRLVASGEMAVGLTDFDDIRAGVREGLPVRSIELKETLGIPNTVALVLGGPHPENAQTLLDYLKSDAVADQLLATGALEGVRPPSVKGLEPDWRKLAESVDKSSGHLKQLFLTN